MENNVDVSIVIATFHRDATLTRALDSLNAQTFKNFEVIVVDDNGSDEWHKKVFAIIERFSDLRIKYIKNEKNMGSAESRNIGIYNSVGKYIAFLDDDDEYLPEKIEKQYEFMKQGDYDFSITDLELYNENGKLADRRVRSYIKDYDKDSLLKYHFMYHMTGTDTLMFRREYIIDVKGFGPVNVGDEFYLMQRAIEHGGKFGYLDRCDVKAYVHYSGDGMSSGNGKVYGENELFNYKKEYFSRFDNKSIRYIKMRHYAVLSFAEMRRKNFRATVANGVKSFVSAPVECIKLISGRSL